jgi:putative transposase
MSTEQKYTTILMVVIWAFFSSDTVTHIAWPIVALVSCVFGYVIAAILKLTAIRGFGSSFFIAWVFTLVSLSGMVETPRL